MKKKHLFLVAGLGALAFIMPILNLKPYVACSIQLLAYVLILTKRDEDENLSRAVDLTLIERMTDCPEDLNLERSVFKTLSDLNFEADYREVLEKAVHESINGRPMEETFGSHSHALDEMGKLLIKLTSSLFTKDAVSAKKILRSYIFILKENEVLKNERRTLFSEARFRARIMLVISASLMGFISAAAPILSMLSMFSTKPILQYDLSQLISLFLYVLSISILVHRALAFRMLAKTVVYSMLGFIASFLIFGSIIGDFVARISV